MRPLPKKLLHGGDYNPDQWLDRPDILAQDLELMERAHVNCVTLGVFAWSRLEPREGEFDLDWLEDIMDALYARGIYTILATPTGAMPRWLTDRYPEANKMNADGTRRIHGMRHNFCFSAPIVRARMEAVDGALARRFGHHPGLIAWHISNEYGGDPIDTQCHCPHCQAAFRTWLKARYGTLEALNRAWWTDFWSNRISDWEEIHSPTPLGETALHALKLDWKRFTSDRFFDFCSAEVAAIRPYSDAPAVSNLMGVFQPIDYFKLAQALDIAAYDSYPHWHRDADDPALAADAAFAHALTRSLKRQPFLLMESVPSAVNWAPRCSLKRPGMHMLSSLQAVACGSDSVQYFQWRKSRGASEKYHGAVVDHKNGGDTRVFRDVAAVGARLEKLGDRVLGTCNRPKVALVFDWENWWAVEDAQAVTNHPDYPGEVRAFYRALWELGVDADIINMTCSLTDYALVLAPMNYMYRGDYAQRVREFVRAGGVYLTTYWSGEVDESDLCFLDRHPLADVLGIRTEEIDVRPLHTENHLLWEDRAYAIKDLCAIVHAESAQVQATYERDFYAGYPALTRNAYGAGTAWFLAAQCGGDLLWDLCALLTRETGTACALPTALPHGVTVSARSREDGSGTLWFVQNFNAAETALSLPSGYRDAETGRPVTDPVLTPYQCLILERHPPETAPGSPSE